MQLVSGRVEFNACQVSLMWHNFFSQSMNFSAHPRTANNLTYPYVIHFIGVACGGS